MTALLVLLPEPAPLPVQADEICGLKCPSCGANPGCLKGWEHFNNSKHMCMNCAHMWW